MRLLLTILFCSLVVDEIVGTCPPPVRSHNDFLEALKVMGHGRNITGGWIVNIGAALVHPGNHHSNHDLSWDLFFREAKLQLRMVAFEGSPSAIAANEREFATYRGPHELDEERTARVVRVNEYVHPATLASELHKRGVPTRLVLLKVDIDSFDLQAADSVVAAHRPLLIYVELGCGLPPFTSAGALAFAALSPADGAPRARYAANVNAYNRFSRLGCAGATFRAWETWGQARGYAMYTMDPQHKNALLVEAHAHHRALSDPSCHAPLFKGVLGAKLNTSNGLTLAENPQGWKRVLTELDTACKTTSTPYMIQVDGECCPERLGANSSRCRCSYET